MSDRHSIVPLPWGGSLEDASSASAAWNQAQEAINHWPSGPFPIWKGISEHRNMIKYVFTIIYVYLLLYLLIYILSNYGKISYTQASMFEEHQQTSYPQGSPGCSFISATHEERFKKAPLETSGKRELCGKTSEVSQVIAQQIWEINRDKMMMIWPHDLARKHTEVSDSGAIPGGANARPNKACWTKPALDESADWIEQPRLKRASDQSRLENKKALLQPKKSKWSSRNLSLVKFQRRMPPSYMEPPMTMDCICKGPCQTLEASQPISCSILWSVSDRKDRKEVLVSLSQSSKVWGTPCQSAPSPVVTAGHPATPWKERVNICGKDQWGIKWH